MGHAVRVEAYDPASYGEAFADVYDDWYGRVGDEKPAVDRLTDLAGRGPVLELGVGTGRLAIPLAARGVDVWGLDASPAMLERLRGKPGADRVHTIRGDMAAFDLDGRRFRLVVVAYNTLFNLTPSGAQARCLGQIAVHLAPGGMVVIEAFVPVEAAGPATPPEDVVEVRRVEADRVVLTVSRVRPEEQVVEGHHVELTDAGVRLRPWRIRFLTPAQLDELALAAGLRLEARWGGWREQPFDDTSESHVSIYRGR